MILVASPSKPFTYTAKAMARRQAVINDYDPEINAVYGAVAETTRTDAPVPNGWKLPQTLDFVRNIVKKVLTQSVDDEDDLFQHGCDRFVSDRYAVWAVNFIEVNALVFKQPGSET